MTEQEREVLNLHNQILLDLSSEKQQQKGHWLNIPEAVAKKLRAYAEAEQPAEQPKAEPTWPKCLICQRPMEQGNLCAKCWAAQGIKPKPATVEEVEERIVEGLLHRGWTRAQIDGHIGLIADFARVAMRLAREGKL